MGRARIDRGIVLDLAVFVVNLLMMRGFAILANSLLHAAVEDVRAKLAIGLFLTGLVVIQPVGPVLKRWSFHQRHRLGADSAAGCFVFWFMFVYLVMMFALCTAAAVILGEVFPTSEGVAVPLTLVGLVWSIASVVFFYRYFVTPEKPPRWTFLTTPAAEHLGDACVYLNAIGLQILWGSITSSAWFRELVTQTPLGTPGSVTDILGRLLATAAFAAVIYLPGRILYLAEDKHRALTYATMLLANLPLILRIVLAPAAHR